MAKPKHPPGDAMTLGNMRAEPDLQEHRRLINRALTRNAARHVASLALAIVLMQSVTGAWAAESGNTMLPGCKLELSRRDSHRKPDLNNWHVLYGTACVGKIVTLIDVAQILTPQYRFCPPEGATNTQGLRIVVAFIEARPQDAHRKFDELALEALRKAWPCR